MNKCTTSRSNPRGNLFALYLCLCMLCCITPAIAQQTPSVSIDVKDQPLKTVFRLIEEKGKVIINYNEEEVNAGIKVTVQVTQVTPEQALQSALRTTAYEFVRSNGAFIIRRKAAQKKPGIIAGKILDEENGEPVPGVSFRIGSKGTVTGIDGSFSLELPKGTYEAEVSSIGYVKKLVTDIPVKEGGVFELNMTLKRQKGQLSTVVVRGSARKETIAALYSRQKNHASTTDGISREQIMRTPDNNVAQVLNRVSGINMQDNKFAIVRGLSDRYNNVMLNGSVLPSTEPNVRNFSFDIIPSALIDNVLVYKTATPDISAEFSGGIVEVHTRDIPLENLFCIKLGTGFNTKTTGKDFYQPARGKYDFLGFDDGGRQLPEGYSYNEYARWSSEGYYGDNEEARQKYGEMSARFPQRFRMNRYTGTPVQDYELNIGRVKNYDNGRKFGALAAITYRNDQNTQHYIDQVLSDQLFSYEGDQYTFNTTLSGMLNAGYSSGRHKLGIKNMVSRKFSERSNIYLGKDLYNGTDLKAFANFPLINTILQSRLEGEHALGRKGLKVLWHGSYSIADRDEPDNKRLLGSKQPSEEVYGYVWNNDNLVYISDYYSTLKERRATWSAEVQQPFTLLKQQQLLKAGYQGSQRTADFKAELFTIRPDRGHSKDYYGIPYYDVFAPENFGSTGLFYYPYLANPSRADMRNGYEGSQQLHAAFLMLDGRITSALRLAGGIRMEQNDMKTTTLGLRYLPDGTPVSTDTVNIVKNTSWLPSVNLIYSLTPRINIRASWFKTLARPEFRELAFFEYFEADRNTWVTGNGLQQTDINNVDLRFEYYPTPQEIISISGFYKKFRNPIELQMEAASSSPDKTLQMQYMNLESATDLGLEINIRKSLAFIHPASSFFNHVFVSGNFTWLDAKVKLKGEERTQGTLYNNTEPALIVYPVQQNRPLYGQAPYIINASLLYAGDKLGVNIGYNRTGPRIVTGAEFTEYNEYEDARDVIDLQISYKFMKNNRAEVKTNAADLLNQPMVRYFNNFKNYHKAANGQTAPDANGIIHIQDPGSKGFEEEHDELRRKYWYGRSFSISFSYNF